MDHLSPTPSTNITWEIVNWVVDDPCKLSMLCVHTAYVYLYIYIVVRLSPAMTKV